MNFDYTKEPGSVLNNRFVITDEVPLVSIVTPFYNSGKYFEQTYNSVLNQTFPYFEWIIVNDGSTNAEDVELIKQLSTKDIRIKVLDKENGGAAGARNYGVNKSNSEIIVFIDADDLIDEKYLEYIYFALHCNPDAAWAYSDSLGFYESEYLWQENFSSEKMKSVNLLSYIAGIRKSIFLKVGGYDTENKNLWEDWQFWLKLLKHKYYPVHVKQVLFWYRRLASGALAAIEKDEKLTRELLSKIERAGKDVPDGIRAITFDGKKGKEFERPRKWEWDRTLSFKKEKVRILMLLPHMELGGADKFNLDIVSNIDKDQFEVAIITTVPARSEWKQAFAEQVSDIFELPSFLEINDWSAFIHYFIKSRSIDIVMDISSYYGYYIMPWLRKEFPNIGLLDCVHCEGKYWRAGGYPRASVVIDDILEKTFVTNEFTRQIMINNYGKPAEKIETLYTGVDESYFNKEALPENSVRQAYGISVERPVVLYLCRIAAEKRPFLMVEIAKEVKKRIKNICFMVVGDGPQFDELKEVIEKEHLEEIIYLTGRQDDIRPFYAECDISLVCSIKEGLAITTFESMLMEKPVVSADVGGQRELVNNETGRLVPCLQDEAADFDKRDFDKVEIKQYADAIVDILSNRENLKSMGVTCRNKVLNGFTLSQMVKRLENDFLQIKAGKGAENRKLLSASLAKMPNIIDDYLTIYCSYENMCMEAGEVWRAREWYRSLYEASQKREPEVIHKIEMIQSYNSSEAEARLKDIYMMRTWKLVEKYIYFMDKTRIGKVLNKIKITIRRIRTRNRSIV